MGDHRFFARCVFPNEISLKVKTNNHWLRSNFRSWYFIFWLFGMAFVWQPKHWSGKLHWISKSQIALYKRHLARHWWLAHRCLNKPVTKRTSPKFRCKPMVVAHGFSNACERLQNPPQSIWGITKRNGCLVRQSAVIYLKVINGKLNHSVLALYLWPALILAMYFSWQDVARNKLEYARCTLGFAESKEIKYVCIKSDILV